MLAAAGKVLVHRDQILHAAHLGTDHDPIRAESQALVRAARCPRRRRRWPRASRRARAWVRLLRVLVHQACEQVLIEAPPVHADAYRLLVAAGGLDHFRELRIALRAAAHVAGIDAQLGERLGAGGVGLQELVAVEVKIADQRRRDALRARLSRMCGTAAAASSLLTVMRTSSDPARASALTWATVASMSAVSVLVIDCTTMGALPPTVMLPIFTARDFLRDSWPPFYRAVRGRPTAPSGIPASKSGRNRHNGRMRRWIVYSTGHGDAVPELPACRAGLRLPQGRAGRGQDSAPCAWAARPRAARARALPRSPGCRCRRRRSRRLPRSSRSAADRAARCAKG